MRLQLTLRLGEELVLTFLSAETAAKFNNLRFIVIGYRPIYNVQLITEA
jgi:hypothetical protein